MYSIKWEECRSQLYSSSNQIFSSDIDLYRRKFHTYICFLFFFTFTISVSSQSNLGCTNISDPSCGFAVVTCAAGTFGDEHVAAIVDVRNTFEAPLGDNWSEPTTSGFSPVSFIKPDSWKYSNIGQIFGIAVNPQNGDIFFAASDIYAYDGDPFNPTVSGFAGSAGIYKSNISSLNTTEALVTTSPTFLVDPLGDNQIYNSGNVVSLVEGNGLGNITIDPLSNRLFVTNTEDGWIYSIDASSGEIKSVHDPFGSYVPLDGLVSPGELLWAVTFNECSRTLYFNRQTSPRNPSSAGAPIEKEVWQIEIDPSGDFVGTESLTLVLGHGSRSKITDISFSRDCNQMLIAERGTVHNSQAYLYDFNGNGWDLNTNVSVGNTDNMQPWKRGMNVSGGVSFGAQIDNGTEIAGCDYLLWITADCMDPEITPGECNAYGFTGVAQPNASLSDGSDINIFVDITPESIVDPLLSKFGLGDIEVFNCCCGQPPIAISTVPTLQEWAVINLALLLSIIGSLSVRNQFQKDIGTSSSNLK